MLGTISKKSASTRQRSAVRSQHRPLLKSSCRNEKGPGALPRLCAATVQLRLRPRWGPVAPGAGRSYASPVRFRDWWGMTLRTRLVAVTLLLVFSLASCGGDNSTQQEQGSQKQESDTTTSAEVSSCV